MFKIRTHYLSSIVICRKKVINILILLFCFSLLLGCSNNNKSTNITSVLEIIIAKDDLQKIYLETSNEMQYDKVLEVAKKSNLPYAEQKFANSQVIKIAFDKEVLPDRHGKSGDYFSVHFSTKNKDKILYIEYFHNSNFKAIIDFSDGTYWDLRGKKDAGLYGNIPGNPKQIFSSKEEQLNFVNAKK